jgi:hypothetical protein
VSVARCRHFEYERPLGIGDAFSSAHATWTSGAAGSPGRSLCRVPAQSRRGGSASSTRSLSASAWAISCRQLAPHLLDQLHILATEVLGFLAALTVLQKVLHTDDHASQFKYIP